MALFFSLFFVLTVASSTSAQVFGADAISSDGAREVEPGSVSAAEEGTLPAVHFPDPALEAAVRVAVGIPSAPLLPTDLVGKGFTSLDAVGHGITNITGISYCTDLTWLRLGQNKVADLSELAALGNLKSLFLGGNQISNISPLSGLTKLTHLELWDNAISDLTPITLLTRLQSLNLSNNPLADITPLVGLTKLRTLYIHGAYISDISSIAALTKLVHVGMIDNRIQDISPLAGLTRLHSVEISNNEIEDLSPLAGLAALKELSSTNNRIHHLDALRNHLYLATLRLGGNQIVDIPDLEDNPGLGAGDSISLEQNPLSHTALCSGVPALRARGATVHATGDCSPDPDGDGLADSEEDQLGTDPNLADTDGDGLDDGDEVDRATNPLLADSDGDGIPDGTEVNAGTDPANSASLLPEVYVDGTSGSDTDGFGTQAHPWATIAFAVASVKGSSTNAINIRVAEGVYTRLNKVGGALRLDSHEHLLGGYEASGWTRDSNEHPAVLDASLAWEGLPSQNTVIFENIVDAILDGFTVTGANSIDTAYAYGAGILGKNLDASSSVRNCLITNNSSNTYGSGGIHLVRAKITISGCTITENFTRGMGGGIGIVGVSQPVIDQCTIAGNSGTAGGGIAIGQSVNALITNCVVSGNAISGNHISLRRGGGILVHAGTGTIVNSTIASNDSVARGGGIAVQSNYPPRVINSIFSGNRNAAIADFQTGAETALENCLFHGNPEGDYYRHNSGSPIIYAGADAINANVSGASGNVDGDPLFNVALAGAWSTAPRYNVQTLRTTFTDSAATFTPGALRNRFIALSADGTLQALVLDNTVTSVEVCADYSNIIASGNGYYVIDYHLAPGSAAIDMGLDTSAPADGAVTVDRDVTARGIDGDSLGAATGDGSDYDIGAFESNTPVVLDSIAVISPNGGETLTRGEPAEIRWISTENVGAHVAIIVHKGSTKGTIANSTTNDGSFLWRVPTGFPTGPGVYIEIRSVDVPAITDICDGSFTVASSPPPPAITVTAPNGGETFARGELTQIHWTSTGGVGANVKITARKGTTSAVISSSTPNDGSYLWQIPGGYPLGPEMYIEIRSIDSPTVLDTCDGTFTLVP